MMKTCTRCGETKDLDEFHFDRGGRHGVKGHCKDCVLEKRWRAVGWAPLDVRCLHNGCHREGVDLPEGRGFRFCDRHAPAARQVLDHPVGRAFSFNEHALEKRRQRNRKKRTA